MEAGGGWAAGRYRDRGVPRGPGSAEKGPEEAEQGGQLAGGRGRGLPGPARGEKPTALASTARVRPQGGQERAGSGALVEPGGAGSLGLALRTQGVKKEGPAGRLGLSVLQEGPWVPGGASLAGGGQEESPGSQHLPPHHSPLLTCGFSAHTPPPTIHHQQVLGQRPRTGPANLFLSAPQRMPTELLDSQHLEVGSWGRGGGDLDRTHREAGKGLTAPGGSLWPGLLWGAPAVSPAMGAGGGLLDPARGRQDADHPEVLRGYFSLHCFLSSPLSTFLSKAHRGPLAGQIPAGRTRADTAWAPSAPERQQDPHPAELPRAGPAASTAWHMHASTPQARP